MLALAWFALLICVGTTADRMHDLAFEAPDVIPNAEATTEEVDNPGEHLLMPSPRMGDLGADAITVVQASDLAASALVLQPAPSSARTAWPSHDPPSRPHPVSFSVPLRI